MSKPGTERNVSLERNLTDEIVRAAIREVDEHVFLSVPIIHDGTVMVLVPEGIHRRLERAVTLYLDVIGRPVPHE